MKACYNGTLVLPRNYVPVNQEEMAYVDGGIDWGKVGEGFGQMLGGGLAFAATALAVMSLPVTAPIGGVVACTLLASAYVTNELSKGADTMIIDGFQDGTRLQEMNHELGK